MHPTLLTALAAVAGFIAKSLWDLFWKRREEYVALARQKRIEFLERQLSLFYWPLYIHLQKNNVVWDHLANGISPSLKTKKTVDNQLCQSFFLPNHEAMLRVIEGNIHLAQADEILEDLLLRFIRHVAIFKALRDGGLQNIDPVYVGVPWPKPLFPVLEQRLRSLQQQYDREIGRPVPEPTDRLVLTSENSRSYLEADSPITTTGGAV